MKKRKKMVNKFMIGDLIAVRSLSSRKNSKEKSIGLVYGVKNGRTQTLYVTPKSSPNSSYSVRIGTKDLVEGTLPREHFIMTDEIAVLKNELLLRKIGRVAVHKIDAVLRHMTRNIVEKHYNSVHVKDKFIPGKSYIRYAGRVYDAEEMKTLVDSALDFWLTAGRHAKQFKEKFSDFLGVKNCILTNSGSSANLLAVSALTSYKLGKRKLEPGDEVITTACAFPTTVNPIVQNNLIPVFLDVGLGDYNIQAERIEDALSKKTKAIFLAHTLGNPFDLDRVIKIAKKHGLWVIEDNCDALGSKYNGKYTGTFGHIATFSFYPPHHITMGEGGALVTDNTDLKKIIWSFRDWGRDCWCEPGHDNTCGRRFGWKLGSLPFGYDHKYICSHIGYNLKLTDMQAAVGLAQLKKLPWFIKARKKNWKILYEGLRKYEDYFILPKQTRGSDPSWFGFLLTVRENVPFSKNEIVNYLEENKVATRMLFSGNITRQPSFKNVKFRIWDNLKNTDFIMNNTFWVGLYPGMTGEMLNFVIDKIGKFVQERG